MTIEGAVYAKLLQGSFTDTLWWRHVLYTITTSRIETTFQGPFMFYLPEF